jgi:hypothetical protein
VFVKVEHAGQSVVLTLRQQLGAAAGDAQDAVERVTGAPTPFECLLLNAWRIRSSLNPANATTWDGSTS